MEIRSVPPVWVDVWVSLTVLWPPTTAETYSSPFLTPCIIKITRDTNVLLRVNSLFTLNPVARYTHCIMGAKHPGNSSPTTTTVQAKFVLFAVQLVWQDSVEG